VTKVWRRASRVWKTLTEKARSMGLGTYGQYQYCVLQAEPPTLFSMWMDVAMQQLPVCGQMISRNVNQLDVYQLWKGNRRQSSLSLKQRSVRVDEEGS